MRNKLTFSAILAALLFALSAFSVTTANATAFGKGATAFGLYCEDENAVLKGFVTYSIDENGKAVQYSQYTVNNGTFYVPFISSGFNIPEIDIDLQNEICYGSVELSDKFTYDFYSSDLNGMTGTVYALNAKSESFTVDFTMSENQNCICKFTQEFRMIRNSKHIASTINGAQTDITYEVFILNGDCTGFKSSAEITKETVTVKEYIDRQFNEFKDLLSAGGDFTPSPDLFYALANQAVANNINYDYFNFFIDSFAQTRLNAYKIEAPSPCSISYSMPVEVQKNGTFTPAIYKIGQASTGNYSIDYVIELNGELPFIIESSTQIEQRSENVYAAENVNGDFYFVFSSSPKPEANRAGDGDARLKIVLFILSGVAVCALISITAVLVVYYKKVKK